MCVSIRLPASPSAAALEKSPSWRRARWICIRGAARLTLNGWRNSLRQIFTNDVKAANTAQQVLDMLGAGLASQVAGKAKLEVEKILRGAAVTADVMIVDRAGKIIAHAE